jgi:acyl-CoA thioester hydrolase
LAEQANRIVKETTFFVRYAETDAMGIVHHGSYILYFEEGRLHYARQRGSDYASFESSGFYLTVVEVNVRYLKPAVYGQQVTVRCWIKEMGSRGLTFAYEVVNAETDDLHVTGTTKHICITHEGKIAKLPQAWRKWSEEPMI